MVLQAGGAASAAVAADVVCSDCGAPVSGNFCSSCGADHRKSSIAFLGSAVAPVRRSFPVVYLKILRAPIRTTVAFAEDPTYRNYLSFALTGIAIYCLFMVPVVMNIVVPAGGNVHVSESLMSLMKVLSQVGVYVGTVITFFVVYGAFRLFAPARRSLPAYFKLFCLALGFTAPINASYEFLATQVLHGVGMTAVVGLAAQWAIAWGQHFAGEAQPGLQAAQAALLTPTALASLALYIALVGYAIGIHRRYWRMSVWTAGPLYMGASFVSSFVGYVLMWWVGFYTASILTAAGVVTP
jgi:hypothetical protein